jgi:small subunit ribosomal protein S16
MVKIRLRRMGAKKQPTYRFVVADSRSPRDGRFIEILGHYNPRTEPKTLEVNADKAREWLSKGAQPTETVRRLFAEKGIMERGPVPTVKRAPRKGKE